MMLVVVKNKRKGVIERCWRKRRAGMGFFVPAGSLVRGPKYYDVVDDEIRRPGKASCGSKRL